MKKFILLLGLIGLALGGFTQKTIPDLPTAASLSATDLLIVWQSNATKKYAFSGLQDDVWKGIDFYVANPGSSEDMLIGYQAGWGYSSGTNNIGIGPYTLGQLSGGLHNIAIGSRAGYSISSGQYNILFGRSVGIAISTGGHNIGIGSYSLTTLVTGSNNITIGGYAGYTLDDDADNVFIGLLSGFDADTSRLVGVGAYSLYNVTTGLGNSAFGYKSLYTLITGTNNTALGYQAGYSNTGSGCIFIGANAGYSSTTSNYLYIENSNSETPLIGGNFSTDRVGINLANASLAHTLDVGGIVNSTGGYNVDASPRIDGSGFFVPTISSDAAAPNNSIYYSTTQSKLVYKDSGGGVNVLY